MTSGLVGPAEPYAPDSGDVSRETSPGVRGLPGLGLSAGAGVSRGGTRERQA
ncbi:hypothetical protein EES47_08325 [Streptomyces sp. ADI98-12]|uniref:Uncharacterized protein n=1 Tax=Streptomyces griseus TaxID=1911 RepID=A0A380P0X1_STRGR|nr:hypothetical protein [Streptomyces sp. DSM 41037]RPK90607.1 hypothetical protein EES47_08325 [Streptomyces sp. ADI98-12]SUP57881.1 Uncharacterised protein [Streptomyces griseus]